MTSSKVHKNVIPRKTLFFEPRKSSTLAPIYDKTFLFDSFPPFRVKLPPKKHLLPIFKTIAFFLNFFSPSYMFWLGPQTILVWGCRDSPFGGGVKIKFSKLGWKVVFMSLQKQSEYLVLLTHLLTLGGLSLYRILQVLEILANQFTRKLDFNALGVSPQIQLSAFCRVTAWTQWAVNLAAMRRWWNLNSSHTK